MTPVVCIPTRQNNGFRVHDLRVEVSVLKGLQNLSLTGLAGGGLRDARDKIRALLHNSVNWDPLERLVVNLAPQELPKCGAHLELPIVVACWVALQPELREDSALLARLHSTRFYGSLDLSGRITDTTASETLRRDDPTAIGAPHFPTLRQLFDWLLSKQTQIPQGSLVKPHSTEPSTRAPLPKVEGRYVERLALLVAATIRTPILLVGAPGTGKTYLAQWSRGWYPGDPETKSDSERIWRSAGFEVLPSVPFLNPHARTHVSEFLGYHRSGQVYPGLFSLAHGGLMVLDEFPELARDVREIFRNVLDQREVRRFTGKDFTRWPADFWLIATANPCACGRALPRNMSKCRCRRGPLGAYQARFSGPLLDRFGMQLFMETDSQCVKPLERLLQNSALKQIHDTLDADADTLVDTLNRARRVFRGLETGMVRSRQDLNRTRLWAGLRAIGIPERNITPFLEHFTLNVFDGQSFR